MTSSDLNQQTITVSGQSYKSLPFTGIKRIDAYFHESNGAVAWNSDPYLKSSYSVNNSTVISFSFADNNALSNSDFFALDDNSIPYNPISYTASQKEDIRTAFNEISTIANITFVEVEEIGEKVGTIRLFINSLISSSEGSIGDAVGDVPGSNPSNGDIIFSPRFSSLSFSNGENGLLEGEYGTYSPYSIMIHEIGHTLGLEHPWEHPVYDFPDDKEFSRYTVMTGTEGPGHEVYRHNDKDYTVTHGPMVYDIATYHYLYGANPTHNLNNTTYTFDPKTPFIKAIWDAGGNDTLNFNNFSKSQIISLVDGEYSTTSFDVNWSLVDNLGIAFNAIIENAVGGSGDDQITGNKYTNNIRGNGGNDLIDGGLGSDTSAYLGKFLDYAFTLGTDTLQIADQRTTGTTDGTDTLKNIEYLQFSDITVPIEDVQGKSQLKMVVGEKEILTLIRDYDGNLHANTGSVSEELKSAYKYQGLLDVNANGIKEAIYTNKESGRWVTASVDSITGQIDYSDHGAGGTTRVVGIYIDPLVASGDVVQGSDHDSQRRFQNDLKIDNLLVKASGDYDGDGTNEVYWKTVDGTAYLRSIMHADGNIQYANYQNLQEMTNYLTTNGFADTVALIA